MGYIPDYNFQGWANWLSSLANVNKSQLRPDPVCLKACHRQAQLWACLDTAKRQVIILSYHGWYCCCHGKENWKHLTTHFSKQTEKRKVPVCIFSVCISMGLTVLYPKPGKGVKLWWMHKWREKIFNNLKIDHLNWQQFNGPPMWH